MDSSFDGTDEKKSKLEVAKESLLALLGRLTEKDQFGLVVFDDKARVVQPMKPWSSIEVAKLKEQIIQIKTIGGTSLSAGITTGTAQYTDVLKKNDPEVENRLIFLTDMCPNAGTTDGKSLFDMAKANADKKVYTTFVGLGVDFNTELVSLISTIRASNYLSVKSTKEFKKHLEEEFDYLVTPNVFDCAINLESSAFTPVRVYGSPGHEIPDKGRLLFIDSSFPSPKESDTMTKGGVIVVKFEKNKSATGSTLKLNTSYKDRKGKSYSSSETFQFPEDKEQEQFSDTSCRKAVLLVRYVNFMKQFLRDAKKSKDSKNPVVSISETTGIPVPEVLKKEGKSWHSEVVAMKPLGAEYKALFSKFIAHFEKEMEAIDDSKLDRELQQILTIFQVEDKKPNKPAADKPMEYFEM
jgi:Ca-activated chloride channel family protein